MYSRIFHNVGNALFAVERIGGKAFVYDCGGQDVDILESAIINTFNKGDEIEAVFISHYDSDHINGLYFLLNYCKVKRLILPMMPDAIKMILLITQNYDVDLERFVISPEEYVLDISQETKVIYVYDIGEDIFYNAPPTMSFEQLSQSDRNIPSGMRLTSNMIPNWVFIPMCITLLTKRQSDVFIQKLYNLLNLPSPTGRANIKELWENYNLCIGKTGKITSGGGIRNKIKKAIKEALPGLTSYKINATSQTLYSGFDNCVPPYRAGCLYLGDFDACGKWTHLVNVYGIYRNNIRIIQVPHHGSKKYFNDNLIDLGTIAVISSALDGDIAIGDTIDRIVKRSGIPIATGSRGSIYIECHQWASYIYPDGVIIL